MRGGISGAAAVVAIWALSLCAGSAGEAAAAERVTAKARSSIVGGGKANFARWQFAVAILRKGRFSCGGAVISPTRVLTAGHCAAGVAPAGLAVIANRFKLTNRSAGEVIAVSAVQIHPAYATPSLMDVAVLTLSRPTSAPAIEVPSADEATALTVPGRPLRVAGWGARDPFGLRLSPRLKRTTERVRSNRRCQRAYGPIFTGATMLCAQGRKLLRFRPLRTTACVGDSGGPLVADTPLGPRVVGLVSYGGAICGIPGAATVYSRVGAGADFIKAAMGS